MSTYVIGDIQGCFDELQQLLEKISFNTVTDSLIFAGDLVNRGPKSLQVLRFVKSLGRSADSVLGNHDLHLLAMAYNNHSHASGKSLDAILNAPDRIELIEWLRHRPVMINLPENEVSIIHAGLPPQWSLKNAISYAGELEKRIQSKKAEGFFRQMYGNKPVKWRNDLSGMKRLRFITNCFTRLRYCSPKGELCLNEKSRPREGNKNLLPWFDVSGRKTAGDRILFGHWSTLGLVNRNNAWCLDTGCLWGGSLTALRVEDMQIFQLACQAAQNPAKFS